MISNALRLWHGFVSLEDASTVAYLVTSPFSPTEEFEINLLDPEIGIEWGLPVGELRLSPKDKAAPSLKERLGEGKLPGQGLIHTNSGNKSYFFFLIPLPFRILLIFFSISRSPSP